MMTTTLSIDVAVTPVADEGAMTAADLVRTVGENQRDGAAFQDAVARFQAAMGEGTCEGMKGLGLEGVKDCILGAEAAIGGVGGGADVTQGFVGGGADVTQGFDGGGAVVTQGTVGGGADVTQGTVGGGADVTQGTDGEGAVGTKGTDGEDVVAAQKPLPGARPKSDGLKDSDEAASATAVAQAASQAAVPAQVEAPVATPAAERPMAVSTVDAANARTQILVEAVEAVCDAILVTPGLVRGEGEMRIQLRADVLSGSEIHLEAKGQTLTVAFIPATTDVSTLIERNLSQFEQHLAGRIHNYQIAAKVNNKVKGLKG